MSLGAPRRLALLVACIAQSLVVLDVSVVNVALPAIQADLHLTQGTASWVAMAYSLGFAGMLLVGARLADVAGTGPVLFWGIGLFTLASAAGGLAYEGWALIGARAMQGLAAAVVAPATFTLLTITHPEGPSRTRAVATWTAVSLVGGGAGNILSGVLTELVSWRAVLLINLPIGAGVIAGALLIRRRVYAPPPGGRLDLVGAILATGGFTLAAYALSAAAGEQETAGPAYLAGLGSVLLFALLVVQQRRTAHPLVPADLLRNRPAMLGNGAIALTATCFQVGLWYFLTYRMQDALDYGPMQAGLGFVPMTVTTLAVNTWVTPRLMARVSSRALVSVGAGLSAVGLAWQAFAGDGAFLLAVLCPSLLIGLAGGLLNTPLATTVTTGVPEHQAGAASGLMNTAKQFGGALGLAAATSAAALFSTDQAAFLLMAALLAAVALLAPHLLHQARHLGRDRSRISSA